MERQDNFRFSVATYCEEETSAVDVGERPHLQRGQTTIVTSSSDIGSQAGFNSGALVRGRAISAPACINTSLLQVPRTTTNRVSDKVLSEVQTSAPSDDGQGCKDVTSLRVGETHAQQLTNPRRRDTDKSSQELVESVVTLPPSDSSHLAADGESCIECHQGQTPGSNRELPVPTGSSQCVKHDVNTAGTDNTQDIIVPNGVNYDLSLHTDKSNGADPELEPFTDSQHTECVLDNVLDAPTEYKCNPDVGIQTRISYDRPIQNLYQGRSSPEPHYNIDDTDSDPELYAPVDDDWDDDPELHAAIHGTTSNLVLDRSVDGRCSPCVDSRSSTSLGAYTQDPDTSLYIHPDGRHSPISEESDSPIKSIQVGSPTEDRCSPIGSQSPLHRPTDRHVSDRSTPATGISSPVTDIHDISSPVTDISSPVTDISSPVTDINIPVTDISSPVADRNSPVTDRNGHVTNSPGENNHRKKVRIHRRQQSVSDSGGPAEGTPGRTLKTNSPVTGSNSPNHVVYNPMRHTDLVEGTVSPILRKTSPNRSRSSPGGRGVSVDGRVSPILHLEIPVNASGSPVTQRRVEPEGHQALHRVTSSPHGSTEGRPSPILHRASPIESSFAQGLRPVSAKDTCLPPGDQKLPGIAPTVTPSGDKGDTENPSLGLPPVIPILPSRGESVYVRNARQACDFNCARPHFQQWSPDVPSDKSQLHFTRLAVKRTHSAPAKLILPFSERAPTHVESGSNDSEIRSGERQIAAELPRCRSGIPFSMTDSGTRKPGARRPGSTRQLGALETMETNPTVGHNSRMEDIVRFLRNQRRHMMPSLSGLLGSSADLLICGNNPSNQQVPVNGWGCYRHPDSVKHTPTPAQSVVSDSDDEVSPGRRRINRDLADFRDCDVILPTVDDMPGDDDIVLTSSEKQLLRREDEDAEYYQVGDYDEGTMQLISYYIAKEAENADTKTRSGQIKHGRHNTCHHPEYSRHYTYHHPVNKSKMQRSSDSARLSTQRTSESAGLNTQRLSDSARPNTQRANDIARQRLSDSSRSAASSPDKTSGVHGSLGEVVSTRTSKLGLISPFASGQSGHMSPFIPVSKAGVVSTRTGTSSAPPGVSRPHLMRGSQPAYAGQNLRPRTESSRLRTDNSRLKSSAITHGENTQWNLSDKQGYFGCNSGQWENGVGLNDSKNSFMTIHSPVSLTCRLHTAPATSQDARASSTSISISSSSPSPHQQLQQLKSRQRFHAGIRKPPRVPASNLTLVQPQSPPDAFLVVGQSVSNDPP